MRLTFKKLASIRSLPSTGSFWWVCILGRWVTLSSQLCRFAKGYCDTMTLSHHWSKSPNQAAEHILDTWWHGSWTTVRAGVFFCLVSMKTCYAKGPGWHDDIAIDFHHTKFLTKKVQKNRSGNWSLDYFGENPSSWQNSSRVLVFFPLITIHELLKINGANPRIHGSRTCLRRDDLWRQRGTTISTFTWERCEEVKHVV